jgi:ABC-type multidrug transport system permease subunit
MTVIAADSVTFVVGGLIYLILLVTLGIIAIRKGHWVMFIIGIFFPLFWLIGALLPPTPAARAT